MKGYMAVKKMSKIMWMENIGIIEDKDSSIVHKLKECKEYEFTSYNKKIRLACLVQKRLDLEMSLKAKKVSVPEHILKKNTWEEDGIEYIMNTVYQFEKDYDLGEEDLKLKSMLEEMSSKVISNEMDFIEYFRLYENLKDIPNKVLLLRILAKKDGERLVRELTDENSEVYEHYNKFYREYGWFYIDTNYGGSFEKYDYDIGRELNGKC